VPPIDTLGARPVAEHAQRRGELRLGDGGGEVVKLGIDEITQVTDRRRAVTRQHVERVGKVAAAVLVRVFCIVTKFRSRSSASL